jgi:hypothetical protein
MYNSLAYRLSLGLTILLTLASFVTLLGWLGTLINGVGSLHVLALLPWKTLGLVALAAFNCTIRAHFIIPRNPMGVTE